MKALHIRGTEQTTLQNIDIGHAEGFSEAWLQEVLFENPDLLNPSELNELDPVIPITRELPLQGPSSKVFLDIFGVRTSGIPVLVECKLWRNPQARREVIGQILEYAALLSRTTYSDVEAVLKANKVLSDSSLYEFVRDHNGAVVGESSFVDKMSNALYNGQFDLIIAGDGIREDVQAVVRMLENSGAAANNLSLLEINVWQQGEERFVVAAPPIRLERKSFSPRYVFIDEEEEISETQSGIKKQTRDPELLNKNRAFWDDFMNRCRFDHPDQEAPRRLNVNSIRVPFLPPVNWITCYRVSSGRKRIGIFMSFREEEGRGPYFLLKEKRKEIEEQIVGIEFNDSDPVYKDDTPTISTDLDIDVTDDSTITEQTEWLHKTLNAWVNLFRPMLSGLER